MTIYERISRTTGDFSFLHRGRCVTEVGGSSGAGVEVNADIAVIADIGNVWSRSASSKNL
jgi:hypothetical protein